MNLLNEFADASQQLEKESSWQETEASKLNSLRNAIIQAISNLLSANIDSGLMHSIGTVNLILWHFKLNCYIRFIDPLFLPVATHHVAEPYTKRDILISENLMALSPYMPSGKNFMNHFCVFRIELKTDRCFTVIIIIQISAIAKILRIERPSWKC